jgi:outer membrane protein assembly factor BamB
MMHVNPRFALALVMLASICTANVAAQDWPGFQGPRHDGTLPDTDLLTDWPEEGPTVRWTQDLGPGFGGAAIRDNTVYLLDRNGNEGDRLAVYDLGTGALKWTADYAAPGRISYHGSRGTPTLTDTHAYAVGPFGHVTCFDLNAQDIAWQIHMDDFNAAPPKWAWSQSPMILGDLVVIAPMARDAGLVALHQKTGKVAWQSGDVGVEGYSSPRLVTLAGTPQIVYFTSTLVSGVDPDSGKVLWTYDNIPVKRAIPTPALVGEDKLFVTAGYDAGSALIRIVKTGEGYAAEELNRDTQYGGQIHSALPVGDHLYVNLNTNENLRLRGKDADGLGCFDRDGNLVWTNENEPDINRGGLIAIGDHLVTLGGEDGVLRLIKADPAGYREVASTKLFAAAERRNMIWAPLAFSDGFLIARSQGQLKCVDLRPQAAAQ